MQNINSVVVTGNLTHDPQLRYTANRTPVVNLRIAVNGRRKDGKSGEWADTVHYFNVTVWGARGKSCAEHLAKGRPVAIEGRLEWSQWDAGDGNGRREGVKIVAETVQFLSSAKPAEAEEAQPETPELAAVAA